MNSVRFVRSCAVVFSMCLIGALATTVAVAPSAGASAASISTSSQTSVGLGATAYPFADAVVTSATSMEGITLRITTGFNSANDRMSLPSPPAGITATYSVAKGLLRLRGTATAAVYQQALRAVQYTQVTPVTGSRTFVVVAGKAIYLPATGNLYEYVTPGGSISWTDARTAALAKTFGSYAGHLANISSAEENDVVLTEITGNTWIGASDQAVEGEWRWVDGPEAGQQFWQGLQNGSVVGARYNNWQAGEPNQYGGGEDYAHMYAGGGQSGKWNDFPDSNSVSGYVVEYEVSNIGTVASLVRLTIGTDTDGDGVTDAQEASQNTDPNDPDSFLDTDGDGVPDSVEDGDGTDENDSNSFTDTDNDDLSDYAEHGYGTNPLDGDSDSDGVGDGTEVDEGSDPADESSFADTDGDGVPNQVEIDNGTNPNNPSDATDTDGDGVPDYTENQAGTDPNNPNSFPDADGDGLSDRFETANGTNPNNADTDGDGVSDGQERTQGTDATDGDDWLDSDNDGVPDSIEVNQSTNPNDANSFLDTDNDGLADTVETRNGSNPNDADSDGDGVSDGDEVSQGTNPNDDDSWLDTDSDGVPDSVEVDQGTNPNDGTSWDDTDSDGVPDYVENGQGSNPNDGTDAVDTDGDGVPDYTETQMGSNPNDADSDGDGVSDGDEVSQGTNPNDDDDWLDTDSDGVPDSVETDQGSNPNDGGDSIDSDSDGVPDYVEGTQGTNPNNGGDATDTDADGIPDYTEHRDGTNPTDADSDDDGLSDRVEQDHGTDPNDADSDGDGYSDAIEVLGSTSPTDSTSFPGSTPSTPTPAPAPAPAPAKHTVTGRVVFDATYDGAATRDEPDVSGVVVRLWGPGPDGNLDTVDDVTVATATTHSPFVLRDVPAGSYVLEVDASTLPAWLTHAGSLRQRVDVDGAEDLGVAFVAKGVIVHGTVLDPAGRPVVGATVTFTDAVGRSVTTTTGPDGVWAALSGLASGITPGAGSVSVVAPDGTRTFTVVSVADNTPLPKVAPITVGSMPVAVPDSLAFSGGDRQRRTVPVALGLIGAGAVLVVVTRRRGALARP